MNSPRDCFIPAFRAAPSPRLSCSNKIDPDGAFRLAYNHAFFDKGVGGEGMVRLERRLVAELAQYAGSVSGNTLVNLAGLASRMAERAPATGGHAEKRDAKPKQASQSTPQPGAADWKSKAGQKRGNRGATAYPGGGKKKQQDNAMPRVFLSRLGDDIVDEEGVKKLVDCLLAKASVAVEGVVVEAKKAFSSKKFNCTLTGLTSDQADALAKVSRKAGHHCDIGGKG